MGDVSGGLLQNAFINIFKSLRHWGPNDDIGLPRVMLPTLSPNLVEVLLFFAIRAQELKQIERLSTENRDELVRFTLFWQLCVSKENNAAALCFQMIREADDFEYTSPEI